MSNAGLRDIMLLKGRYRPLTDTIGFVERPAKIVAEAYCKWLDRGYRRGGRELCMRSLEGGSLADVFDSFLPLSTQATRWLFIDTASDWCAYFDNWWIGPDSTRIAPLAGTRCRCRGIRATSVPNILPKAAAGEMRGSYGATIFEVYKPQTHPGQIGWAERVVSVANDGGRWVFDTVGEPYDFEDTSAYQAKRKRDRFTHEMLSSYLMHFGIDAYSEQFYLSAGGCRGYMVSVEGPPWPEQREYSLAEVQTKLY